MSAKQNQDKLDKRAQALRDNLRKRKPVKKVDKAGVQKGEDESKD